MKKIAISALMLTASSLCAADTAGFYVGIGNWASEFSGAAGVSDIDLEANLGIDEEDNNFAWIAIEHPLPGLPNLRIEHTDASTTGIGDIFAGSIVDNAVFPIEETVQTDLELTYTDATLYYELLDNWINLDLGLTARSFSGGITVLGQDSGIQDSADLDGVLPLLFLDAQIDVPTTGLSFKARANGLEVDGNRVLELRASVMYTFDFPVSDLLLEAGVRQLTLEATDLDELLADVELSGAYLSIGLHF